MNNAATIRDTARALVSALQAAGKTVTTAESCTGGWIAKAITDVSGSSKCFAYGVVSYSNGAKESLLGVDSRVLEAHGAVSEAVVRDMARGALHLSGADLAVSVSGVAGPDGGTPEKPVGTVWICWAARVGKKCSVDAEQLALAGDREAIRSQTVCIALKGLQERIGSIA